MQYKAISPEDYISQIPKERQEAMKKLRKVIKDNLPKGFEEGMNYNMIGYYDPHNIYPKDYHCDTKLPLQFMNIASQKNFMALYHMGMYAKKEILEWVTSEYPKHCKYKLDMGKSCVRFKKIEDIPYDLIGQLTAKMSVDEWIQVYENAFKK